MTVDGMMSGSDPSVEKIVALNMRHENLNFLGETEFLGTGSDLQHRDLGMLACGGGTVSINTTHDIAD